jgi:uncharacterized RmlC-like cupin family protein
MGIVRRIGAVDRTEGDPTSGMVREEAIATDRVWAGIMRTQPGTTCGWHHHGDNESTLYVLAGAIRIEFGPDGADAVEGHPGDFVFVPPDTVHRESNPSGEESMVVIVRAGTGPPTINVDGPGA